FFGRPDHNAVTPHDTWTFHAADENVYTWSRYYGEVLLGREGITGLPAGTITVPGVVMDNDGTRPTIFYSGKLGTNEIPKYLCVCEKLERASGNEDLLQGQKEIMGLYVGDPFAGEWQEFGQFAREVEGETWTLCQVRIANHEYFDEDSVTYDVIMLLGIARKRFISQDTELEVIEYYSASLEYNSILGGQWVISGKYKVDTIDPVYGERWSADLCLFGDRVMSPKMKSYLSQPFSSSQLPYSPYDTYYSGLP
ncbi:unnamed protein product, partial [marine sediment metagenome]